jgi:hypothetical protein
MRRRGRVVIGIDFTSAPRARKPLTVAVGRLVETAGGAAYCLDQIRELGTLAAFDDLLREPGDWLGGFDLPFGQPRTLIEHGAIARESCAVLIATSHGYKDQIVDGAAR